MLADPFKPRHEPALTLYEAFQAEAQKRKGRPLDKWVKAEREAVWRAARDYAQQHGLRIPTLAEVESCERYAMGSVDYGAKWAYQVERVMKDVSGVSASSSATLPPSPTEGERA